MLTEEQRVFNILFELRSQDPANQPQKKSIIS